MVIAAYNSAVWIRETLDSVLAQTFRDFEVIVVDDGSTDRTREVAAEYLGRVRYIYKARGGQPAARNAGIRAARGKYIAFVDADDLWLPEKLDRQIGVLTAHPDLAWVYCDAYTFDSETGCLMARIGQECRLLAGDVVRPLLLNEDFFVPSPTPILRRDVFEEVGYFDESPVLRYGEDWYMWLRVALRYPVGVVDSPLAKQRRHKASMLGSMDPWDYLCSRLVIIKNVVALDPGKLADLRIPAMAMVYRRSAEHMLLRGRLREARQVLRVALALAPRNWRTLRDYLCAFVPPPVFAGLVRARRAVRSRRLGTRLHGSPAPWSRENVTAAAVGSVMPPVRKGIHG